MIRLALRVVLDALTLPLLFAAVIAAWSVWR